MPVCKDYLTDSQLPNMIVASPQFKQGLNLTQVIINIQIFIKNQLIPMLFTKN